MQLNIMKGDSFAGCQSSKKNKFNMSRHTRRTKSQFYFDQWEFFQGVRLQRTFWTVCRTGWPSTEAETDLAYISGQVEDQVALESRRAQVSAPHPSQLGPYWSINYKLPFCKGTVALLTLLSSSFAEWKVLQEHTTLEHTVHNSKYQFKYQIYRGQQTQSSQMKTIPQITRFL